MNKEIEIVRQPEYIVKIEGGVTLLVYDGYAMGSDGKIYRHVGKEVGDELITLGWSCESGK